MECLACRYAGGQRHFGENYVQELVEKARLSHIMYHNGAPYGFAMCFAIGSHALVVKASPNQNPAAAPCAPIPPLSQSKNPF